MTATRRHRIALYNGVFVRHDAISDSLGHKLALMSALAQWGVAVEPVVFTHRSDSTNPAVHPFASTFDALCQEEFWGADLHWFEFGIAYDLFNAIFAVPPGRPILGVYHNVTPLHLVTDPISRKAVQRSMVQRHNLEQADHVACVSALNRADLVEAGFEPDRLSVLPLPPMVPPSTAPRLLQQDRAPNEPVRLLFVGRFVRAKGLIELIEAIALLLRRGGPAAEAVHLTVAGNPDFADEATRAELQSLHGRYRLDRLVTIAGRVEEDRLAELYDQADALVLPSHHEGYCVPVIEALGRGCYPITSSAGSLPATVGGLGTLVPPGDVDALADAIETFATSILAARRARRPARLSTVWGDVAEDQWRHLVAGHLESHSLRRYRRGVLDLLATSLPELAADPHWPEAVDALTAGKEAVGTGAGRS